MALPLSQVRGTVRCERKLLLPVTSPRKLLLPARVKTTLLPRMKAATRPPAARERRALRDKLNSELVGIVFAAWMTLI